MQKPDCSDYGLTAEFIADHGRWRRSRGRRPCLPFEDEHNPRKALTLAENMVRRWKVSPSAWKFRGRLKYTGWLFPWKLVMELGEVDLWPIAVRFFARLKDNFVFHEQMYDGYRLFADETRGYRLGYEFEKFICLSREKGDDFINILPFFETALIRLSGRLVEVEVSPAELKFSADKTEKVHSVRITDDWTARVSETVVKRVCKRGRPDCCIFLKRHADDSFCTKFDVNTARLRLEQLSEGRSRATRIGNCALAGRAERKERKTRRAVT